MENYITELHFSCRFQNRWALARTTPKVKMKSRGGVSFKQWLETKFLSILGPRGFAYSRSIITKILRVLSWYILLLEFRPLIWFLTLFLWSGHHDLSRQVVRVNATWVAPKFWVINFSYVEILKTLFPKVYSQCIGLGGLLEKIFEISNRLENIRDLSVLQNLWGTLYFWINLRFLDKCTICWKI